MRELRFGRSLQLSLGVAVAGAALIMTAGSAVAAPTASGSPSTGLKDGTVVSVTASGFKPSASLLIVQCSGISGPAACDVANVQSKTASASGSVSAKVTVHTGKIGSGTCAAGSTNCVIAVSAGGSTTDAAAVKLSFAAASSPTSSAPTSSAPTSSAPGSSAPTSSAPPATGGSAPTAVSAGTGGLADQHGPDLLLVLLVGLGGVMVIGGTGVLVRRRR